ncbi:unnamed protein product [Cladocopium goreaui]|uniref:Uncharacterized protein n=1 Tax=Cladocopium goreaui TaxID=2562237 RepID=A0A9P1CK78_9DINO|nr:unnamed protein product [Cladocopium goreaui]
MYLLKVYIKKAGMLPNKFQRSARSRKDHEKITAIFEAASDHETEPGDSDHDSGEVEGDVVQLEVDELEQDEELRLHVLGLNSYWSAAIETNFGTNLKNLPARWLAPGTIRMLWMQMCQEAKGVSYKHFWTVFRQNWHQILRFLPSSSHGACDTCVAFKSGFRKALHLQEKFHNAKAYKAHIDSVCQDRDLEAFLQVLDPRVAADSSTVLECASRSIDAALQICKDLGVPKPDQILAWADNCVRENKNGQLLRFLGWLCATGRMRMYQVYGLISTAMRYLDVLADGVDVAEPRRVNMKQFWDSRAHESDAVLMVKRNAADPNLAQDPLLAFPFRYVSRLGPLPSEPRRLKMIKPAKKKGLFVLSEHSSSDPTN